MARLDKENLESAYRYYMSDSIYHYAHNRALQLRFADMTDPAKIKQQNKSGDEIVADLVKNAGIVLR